MPIEHTPEQLRAASNHLHYEVWMLVETACLLASGAVPRGPLHNSVLESLAIHARVVLEVLYSEKNPKFPNDVRASDFLDSVDEWIAVRPEKSSVLNRIHSRVGTEVAHLSYRRQEITAEMKRWPFVQIAREICEAVRAFHQLVSDHLIDDKWQSRSPCNQLPPA